MSYSTPSPASRTLQCATCSPAHALQDFSCLRSAAPPAELAGLGPGFFSDYSCLKPSFSHASALSSMLYQHLAIVSRAYRRDLLPSHRLVALGCQSHRTVSWCRACHVCVRPGVVHRANSCLRAQMQMHPRGAKRTSSFTAIAAFANFHGSA